MGTSILAIVFSLIFYYYNKSVGGSGTSLLVVLFVIVAGLSSLIQWSLFRERLDWWVAENLVAGLVLGLLHNYIKDQSGWDWWDPHLGILLALWIIGNFALGPILMRRPQERSKDSPSIVDTGARQNIFLMLLSVTLILAAIANFSLVLDLSGLLNVSWILYGMAAILASLAFILKKEMLRNFGFITLAIFLFLDGINVELLALSSDHPLYYFMLNGILAIVSGIFFAAQRETWRNFGFIMLSGYLITLGAAGLSVYNSLNTTFLIISAIFGVPAAIFFFLRK
jgi:hypothetical protein